MRGTACQIENFAPYRCGGEVGCGIARHAAVLVGFHSFLDPCYTGKAFRGMLNEMKKDPSRFGERVLFLHSGGGFGTFAYGDQYLRSISR